MDLEIKDDVQEVINNNVEDNEADFFSGLEKPREHFENPEQEEEPTTATPSEGVKLSDTTMDDEASFILVMNLFDNTRAMALSMFDAGNLDMVKDYTYYKDWKDPQHQQLLQAGRIVAKKYTLSAFDKLPEVMICIALIVSSYALFRQAQSNKKERKTKQEQEAYQQHTKPQEQPTAQPSGKIVVMNKAKAK